MADIKTITEFYNFGRKVADRLTEEVVERIVGIYEELEQSPRVINPKGGRPPADKKNQTPSDETPQDDVE